MMKENIKNQILESAKIKKEMVKIGVESIEKAAELLIESIKAGGKILWCGNGGSAADAQHLATELMGGMSDHDRMPIPSIALTTDSSFITAWSNDTDFDSIFSRQVQGLGEEGDVLVGISTSGNSENVIKGLKASKKNGGLTIGLLGNNGGKIKNTVDISLVVNATSVPRIQEAHRVIYHIICEIIEEELARIE